MSNRLYDKRWREAVSEVHQAIRMEYTPVASLASEASREAACLSPGAPADNDPSSTPETGEGEGLASLRAAAAKKKKFPLSGYYPVISQIYVKYLAAYNKLNDCHDGIIHPQKRLLLRQMVDRVATRLLELLDDLRFIARETLGILNIPFADVVADNRLLPSDVELQAPLYFRRSPVTSETAKVWRQHLLALSGGEELPHSRGERREESTRAIGEEEEEEQHAPASLSSRQQTPPEPFPPKEELATLRALRDETEGELSNAARAGRAEPPRNPLQRGGRRTSRRFSEEGGKLPPLLTPCLHVSPV